MRISLKKTSVCVLVILNNSAAYDDYDYSNEKAPAGSERGNTSLTESVRRPLKFSAFYSDYRAELTEVSTTVCNLSLKAYQGDTEARNTLGPVDDYCWAHMNCMMSTVSEHVKASFSGTSILLGLAPTTLSLLGPSVGEMALLSIHRPILALLLSLGAPAIYPGRFLLWDDPLRANEPQTGSFIVKPFSRLGAVGVLLFQNLLAAAATANILQAAQRIGLQGVVSWRCRDSYWPVLWFVLSLTIHFIATLSLRTAIHRKKRLSASIQDEDRRYVRPVLLALLQNETTPSANARWQVSDLFDVKLGPLAVSLQYAGAFMALIHLLFGTMVFSGLLLIGVKEALVLILRFIISATVCRLLLQFEVGGMIKVGGRRGVYKGVVQKEDVEGFESVIVERQVAKGS
ncbi:MAG: hypothetical protein Q9220_003754 [cf. Caloplaca sp. 1 TL-2023]